jgi:RNA:NAD 2'-phosphotransferase (TPT1/KptA family)/8-oxo-dGTP pyrophosphatase MutT (NUDIX family)
MSAPTSKQIIKKQDKINHKSLACCGLCLFSNDLKYVAIGFTPAGHGSLCKGSQEFVHLQTGQLIRKTELKQYLPKEFRRESISETAIRETEEETGLDAADIEVLPSFQLNEYNQNGNLSVRIYVARYKCSTKKPLQCIDSEELPIVEWVQYEDALKLPSLYSTRKEQISEAFTLASKAKESDWIPLLQWKNNEVDELMHICFDKNIEEKMSNLKMDKHDDEKKEPIKKKDAKPISSKRDIYDDWSRLLSKILRHTPGEYGIELDQNFAVPVDVLLMSPNFQQDCIDILKKKHKKLVQMFGVFVPTREDIQNIVDKNDKQRFRTFLKKEANGNFPLYIAANQAHSVRVKDENGNEVDVGEVLTNPLPICVHGTYKAIYEEKIKHEGLRSMTRNDIHFATGYPNQDGVISGMKKNAQIFIEIDMQKAMDAGIVFRLSKNGVILSKGNKDGVLPPDFFKCVQNSGCLKVTQAFERAKDAYDQIKSCLSDDSSK